jgi:hypothetical protein
VADDIAPGNDRLKFKERVVATQDLRGVPAGTGGRVMMVNGLTWFRYRVRFDNGVEIGSLDRRYLERVGRHH